MWILWLWTPRDRLRVGFLWVLWKRRRPPSWGELSMAPQLQACGQVLMRKEKVKQHLAPAPAKIPEEWVSQHPPNAKSQASIPGFCLVLLSHAKGLIWQSWNLMASIWAIDQRPYCMWTLTLGRLTDIPWRRRWLPKRVASCWSFELFP